MKPIDPKKLRTVSAKRRHSKVNTSDFAQPIKPSAGFRAFYDSLPDILRAGDLRALAKTAAAAHAKKRKLVWGIGGHVIKVGLAPLLNDLMRRGLRTIRGLPGRHSHRLEEVHRRNDQSCRDRDVEEHEFGALRCRTTSQQRPNRM